MRGERYRAGPALARLSVHAAIAVLIAAGVCRAQGPQFDIEGPPGASDSRGKLGAPIGASGTSGFDITNSGQPVSGRVGVSASRAPINALNPPSVPIVQPTRFMRQSPAAANPVTFGSIDMPPKPEAMVGPQDGLTLDQAIEMVVQNNLGLIALKYEVPMADADVITAGLRANPVFYADQQLIPYGNYSNARPGGQTQTDVNVNLPIDVNGKRRRRLAVYSHAKKSTEAKVQDAVRNEIDNLYTFYVDAVQAMQTLDYSRRFLAGMRVVERAADQMVQSQQKTKADLDATRVQLGQAMIQVRESEQALDKAMHSLGRELNIDDWRKIRVRALYFDRTPLPMNEQELLKIAMESRPDLVATRFGLARASAEVELAKAARFSDLYVVYQPYTFQNNNYLGLKSAYSWTLGVTAVLPIMNRNQGNIMRTRLNTVQTQWELQDAEKQAVYDVIEAVREFNASLASMIEYKDKIIEDARVVRDAAYTLWRQGGQTSIVDYLSAQKDYNETAKSLRDAVIRHRRSMLDLNTAVGTRVMP